MFHGPMNSSNDKSTSIPRRDFLKLSPATVGALGAAGISERSVDAATIAPAGPKAQDWGGNSKYNGAYSGERLNRIAFPLGGIGAGMICLEGTGAFSHFSLRNRPEVFNEPCTFAAIAIKGKNVARVLEGPVPDWKKFGTPNSGNGAGGSSFGLPRFRTASMLVRFPFASIKLADSDLPLEVELTGWSPFEPGDADNSSLPVCAVEYRFTNHTEAPIDAVFSYSARNFMGVGQNPQAVKATNNGFLLWSSAPKERGWEEGAFTATVDDPAVKVNHAWFRGGWFDSLTIAWKEIAEGAPVERAAITEGAHSPGATLAVPFQLTPGKSKTVVLRFAWHVGQTNLRVGRDPQKPAGDSAANFRPWYSSRFANIDAVTNYWRDNYTSLRQAAERFSDCFYDTTLPPEVIDAIAANLTILKSPTVMRQADGKLWCWEGCNDNAGCCHGSCTHVWNYAQALCHLFPSLERSLRETEFGPSQDERGHQMFRAGLPIRPVVHDFHAAADGQLGGIMKVFREWRISGDSEWLRSLWPKVRASLDYCIGEWDPARKGWVEEPHHNTYDIEFWGPDGMCTSFYLGALRAAVLMGEALGENIAGYSELVAKGTQRAEQELFDGDYFIQKIEWQNLRAKNPLEVKSFGGAYSAEALDLLKKEGPKYQYGTGCLADGVLGSWMAMMCGIGQVLDGGKVASHLRAVHKYNLKRDLTAHPNPQRPSYACGAEGGLLLCTWPKGGALSLPFVYSNEVWTGIEYQVASHLMCMGLINEGLEVVRVCRDRYDGRVRNPFDEYECGHWYARAMSSYGLLQGLSGARYDAVTKTLHLKPTIKGDFRSFLATATGYGIVGVKGGQPFVEVRSGKIDVKETQFTAA